MTKLIDTVCDMTTAGIVCLMWVSFQAVCWAMPGYLVFEGLKAMTGK